MTNFMNLNCHFSDKLIMKNIIFLLRETVVYIFDRYDIKQSIKQMERQRRGNSEAPVYKISASSDVPNYKLFMKNDKKKLNWPTLFLIIPDIINI